MLVVSRWCGEKKIVGVKRVLKLRLTDEISTASEPHQIYLWLRNMFMYICVYMSIELVVKENIVGKKKRKGEARWGGSSALC